MEEALCMQAFTTVGWYALVHWPEENAVSVVKIQNITSPPQNELKQGIECTVKVQKSFFKGTIAALGELFT